MNQLNKILVQCEKQGFFRRLLIANQPDQLKLKIECLGILVEENLRHEWFNNIVINKDLSTFLTRNSLPETFQFAKELCLGNPPFCVAEMVAVKQAPQPTQLADGQVDFTDSFTDLTRFKCHVVVAPSDATQFFHQWQRMRKMWWRKFSPNPGRYTLTDIKSDSGKCQSVDIVATYPWGTQLVESIVLGGALKGVPNSLFQVKDGRKFVTAKCITSDISSSTLLLNSLCDAYDEAPSIGEKPRPLLRLHRKLAPYKLSVAIANAPKQIVDELKDLALYLSRQLRDGAISTLLLPSSHKNSLDSQWRQYDQMGIPYNLLLNERTLKDGIIQLRNRDTTLKEQVHVSSLKNYVDLLFRNY